MFRALFFIFWLKWLVMNRKGKFKVVSSGGSNPTFVTNFGRFVIDRSRLAMMIYGGKRDEEIPFGDVTRLEQGKLEKSAVLEEIAMGGLDLKHDKVEWHSIHLVLRDGRTVPIYAIGEYRVRLPAWQWIAEKERSLFQKLRLSKDGLKASSEVADQIQKLFLDAGQHVPITRYGEPPPIDESKLANSNPS